MNSVVAWEAEMTREISAFRRSFSRISDDDRGPKDPVVVGGSPKLLDDIVGKTSFMSGWTTVSKRGDRSIGMKSGSRPDVE